MGPLSPGHTWGDQPCHQVNRQWKNSVLIATDLTSPQAETSNSAAELDGPRKGPFEWEKSDNNNNAAGRVLCIYDSFFLSITRQPFFVLKTTHLSTCNALFSEVTHFDRQCAKGISILYISV